MVIELPLAEHDYAYFVRMLQHYASIQPQGTDRARALRLREELLQTWREQAIASGRSYYLSSDGATITCLRCGRSSPHPLDIQQRYCGVCGAHDGSLDKKGRI